MNTQIRTIIYCVSAILVVVGAFLHFYTWEPAPYLFAVGAAGIAVCYMTISPKNMPFRKRRLNTFNVIAGLLLIVASGMMFAEQKEWVICLTISALLQLYTAFVTPKEEDKKE